MQWCPSYHNIYDINLILISRFYIDITRLLCDAVTFCSTVLYIYLLSWCLTIIYSVIEYFPEYTYIYCRHQLSSNYYIVCYNPSPKSERMRQLRVVFLVSLNPFFFFFFSPLAQDASLTNGKIVNNGEIKVEVETPPQDTTTKI